MNEIHSRYQDRLESERIITRRLTPSDSNIWAEFFLDEEALKFLPNHGLTTNEQRAKFWIDRQLTRYKDGRFGLQALFDKRLKDFVGQCGLLTQDVEGNSETEVGYHILPKFRGLGYAPEAVRLFIDYAFRQNICDSVISIIDVRNTKSKRVAEKNGLVKEKQTTWSGLLVDVYRLNKADW